MIAVTYWNLIAFVYVNFQNIPILLHEEHNWILILLLLNEIWFVSMEGQIVSLLFRNLKSICTWGRPGLTNVLHSELETLKSNNGSFNWVIIGGMTSGYQIHFFAMRRVPTSTWWQFQTELYVWEMMVMCGMSSGMWNPLQIFVFKIVKC